MSSPPTGSTSSRTLQVDGSREQEAQGISFKLSEKEQRDLFLVLEEPVSSDSTAGQAILGSSSLAVLLPRVTPENVVVCHICLLSQEDQPEDKFLFYPGGGCTHSVCVPCLKLWIREGRWSCGLCRGHPWGNAWKKWRDPSVDEFPLERDGVQVRLPHREPHIPAAPQVIYSTGNRERHMWMIREQMAEDVAGDPNNEELRTRLGAWDHLHGFKVRWVRKRGQSKRARLIRVMHIDEAGREHTVFYKDREDGRGPRLVARTDTGDGNGIRTRPYYFDS